MRLPKSWNEITVSQFQECYFLLGNKPNIDSWLRVISVLSGLTFAEVEGITIKKIKRSIYRLQFLLTPEINTKVKKHIWLKGRIYKAVYQANDLNTAQAIDIKTFLKADGMSTNDTVVENLHKLLASIYLPLTIRGFKYNGSKHEKIANDFLTAKMGDVYGTLFFYSVVYKSLMDCTVAYGNEQDQILKEHLEEVNEWAIQNKILETDGVGR